jgi:hypothetical protein
MRSTHRSSVVRLILAVAISLGIVAPAAADPAPATTQLVVNLQEAGSFSVSLGTYIGFTPGVVTASNGITTNTTVVLRFDDTMSYRSQFRVDLSASNFVSLMRVPYSSPAEFYSIPASNLTLVKNYSPQQAQSSVDTPGVGDIQATDQSGNTILANSSVVWTEANSLETPRNVAKGWVGMGTLLAGQGMELSLNIPAAMPATFYNSILTATVTFETP